MVHGEKRLENVLNCIALGYNDTYNICAQTGNAYYTTKYSLAKLVDQNKIWEVNVGQGKRTLYHYFLLLPEKWRNYYNSHNSLLLFTNTMEFFPKTEERFTYQIKSKSKIHKVDIYKTNLIFQERTIFCCHFPASLMLETLFTFLEKKPVFINSSLGYFVSQSQIKEKIPFIVQFAQFKLPIFSNKTSKGDLEIIYQPTQKISVVKTRNKTNTMILQIVKKYHENIVEIQKKWNRIEKEERKQQIPYHKKLKKLDYEDFLKKNLLTRQKIYELATKLPNLERHIHKTLNNIKNIGKHLRILETEGVVRKMDTKWGEFFILADDYHYFSLIPQK